MKSILSFIFLIQVCVIFSQDLNNIKFEKLDNKNGLSHSSVLSAVQDNHNYMWFGTQDGLNRYDGHDFIVFRPDETKKGTLNSSYIHKLFIDSKSNLWIGGNEGVSRYDYNNQIFINYNILTRNNGRYITDFTEDEKGNLWAISLLGRLFRYDPNLDTFIRVNFDVKNELNYVGSIFFNNNKMLIGDQSGLYEFDVDSSILNRKLATNGEFRIKKTITYKNNFVVATQGKGVLFLDNNYKIIKQLQQSTNPKTNICHNRVGDILFDDKGNLWIGTYLGLSIYNPKNETIYNYKEDFGAHKALSHNSIRCIYQDAEKGIWLGTFYGGVNYYHPSRSQFELLDQNGGKFSLSDNIVAVIKEDKNNNIWIGTNGGGLNFWDRKKRSIEIFDEENLLSSNNLKCIEFISNNKVLIGTHESGFNIVDIKTKKNKIFTTDNSPSLLSNNIYSALKDYEGNIWLGTWHGLINFDEKNNTFTSHNIDKFGNRLASNFITCLIEDSRKRIWIGTEEGITIFNTKDNYFETFKNRSNDKYSLSEDEVVCVYEDIKGRIWVGTQNGLNLFDEIDRSFRRYSTNDGLPNNFIHSILEDDEQFLWISTNNGIAKFDFKNNFFVNYNSIKGFENLQFNRGASLKTSDGAFMFGGINGINIFDPINFFKTPVNSKIFITELSLFNRNVRPKDASGILEKNILFTPEIKLKHDQNFIGIDFTTLDFINSEAIKYQYKLENFDPSWNTTNIRKALYSKLSPGSYLFKVRILNENPILKQQETHLKIEVLQPWWFTTQLKIIYFVLISLMIYFIYTFIKSKVRTKHQLNIAELEKKKLEEINKMKLDFFTNISHEFKTPLTLILSPIERIRESLVKDPWLEKQHNIIYNNSVRLLNLINELLDFRKSEEDALKLQVSKGDILSFTKELFNSFVDVAKENNLGYRIETNEEEIKGYFDTKYLEKILFNLLSNAIKFTPADGDIVLNIFVNKVENIVFEVSNTGQTFSLDEQHKIFEKYYGLENSKGKYASGTGIGLTLTKRLVESHHGTINLENLKENVGVKFIVTLPIDEKSYTIGEFLHEVDQRPLSMKKRRVFIPTSEIRQEEVELSDNLSTVMIVDDNSEIREYLYSNLKEKYNVVAAFDGADALEKLVDFDVDLIISDVMMPNIDGIQLCEKLKQNIKTNHIPIILLTAKSGIVNQIEGAEVGADDYISKPFSYKLLEVKIANIIKVRQRLKEEYGTSHGLEPDKIAFNVYDKRLLTKAIEILEKEYSNSELTVDYFANKIGMSRTSLHNKLKAITGESTTYFINKFRFSKAIVFFKEDSYSISEISYMVGFNSSSYFTSSFKRHFDCLPSEFIQKLKDQNDF